MPSATIEVVRIHGDRRVCSWSFFLQGLKVNIDASGRVLGTDACAKKIDFTQLLEFPRFERDTHQSFRLGGRKVNFLEEMSSHGDARVSSGARSKVWR